MSNCIFFVAENQFQSRKTASGPEKCVCVCMCGWMGVCVLAYVYVRAHSVRTGNCRSYNLTSNFLQYITTLFFETGFFIEHGAQRINSRPAHWGILWSLYSHHWSGGHDSPCLDYSRSLNTCSHACTAIIHTLSHLTWKGLIPLQSLNTLKYSGDWKVVKKSIGDIHTL